MIGSLEVEDREKPILDPSSSMKFKVVGKQKQPP